MPIAREGQRGNQSSDRSTDDYYVHANFLLLLTFSGPTCLADSVIRPNDADQSRYVY